MESMRYGLPGASRLAAMAIDETWPALAGRSLPATADGRSIWAGNAGRSGHNSRDHLMEMEYLVPLLPVDTLVVMMGVNDLGVRLAQDAAHNPRFLEDPNNLAYQVHHAFSVIPEDPNLPCGKRALRPGAGSPLDTLTRPHR